MRRIIFDIETTGDIRVPNYAATELTVACIYDSKTKEYSSYLKEDLPKLWQIFEHADMLIGYNSDHFDIPILNKYYPGDLTKFKSLDLLKEVRAVLGRRPKLDNIAEATLGCKKSGSGLDAMRWWKEGEIEKIKQYCIDDVRITKEVYEYAKKYKLLKYKDYDGPKEVRLDTSLWDKITEPPSPLTHTLPF